MDTNNNSEEQFIQAIQNGYTFKGDSLILGAGKLGDKVISEASVKIALKTLNRHGLIAGATGTGKTKTIQVLSEQLSLQGIPVFMMDIKGDFSGIAEPGEAKDFILDRMQQIGLDYKPQPFPVELMSISKDDGVRLRATVEEFGPVLFSRILDLNDTQSGAVSMVFKYCKEHNLKLISLTDFKKALNYLGDEGKEEVQDDFGAVSPSTVGAILRKIVEIEEQGADLFLGEKSFDIQDLFRYNENGNAYVNILRLVDIQDKPKLFSTFMINLLSELYRNMPEKGDADKPELVLFIDEAHLLFSEADKAVVDLIESTIKLIRSKGIGVYFITQNPQDIPASVLSQLGLKIQHALRAFTANDRKAIKLTVENYPLSDFYDTENLITQLGIGEAFVTALNEKGAPTPLVHTILRAPLSRMDVLSADELKTVNQQSKLYKKYLNPETSTATADFFDKKMNDQQKAEEAEKQQKQAEKEQKAETRTTKTTSTKTQNAALKVFTSASFLRFLFSLIKKLFNIK